MYKADINVSDVWSNLQVDPSARLLDVRTADEWADAGLPLVDGLVAIEWLTMPMGEINPDFLQEAERAGLQKHDDIYVLCRTGPRSVAAATALTAAGYSSVYTVLEGFEGEADANGNRGTRTGWQADGLPWHREEQRTAA